MSYNWSSNAAAGVWPSTEDANDFNWVWQWAGWDSGNVWHKYKYGISIILCVCDEYGHSTADNLHGSLSPQDYSSTAALIGQFVPVSKGAPIHTPQCHSGSVAAQMSSLCGYFSSFLRFQIDEPIFWSWKHQVPPKRFKLSMKVHSVTTQNTAVLVHMSLAISWSYYSSNMNLPAITSN